MTSNEQKKHEPPSLNARHVLWSTGAVITLLLAALAAAGGMMVWLGRNVPPPVTAPPQASWQRDSAMAEVQPNQAVSLSILRRRHQQRLSEYHWLERHEDVARIPIDRAIELLAEHDLAIQWSDARAAEAEEAP